MALKQEEEAWIPMVASTEAFYLEVLMMQGLEDSMDSTAGLYQEALVAAGPQALLHLEEWPDQEALVEMYLEGCAVGSS